MMALSGRHASSSGAYRWALRIEVLTCERLVPEKLAVSLIKRDAVSLSSVMAKYILSIHPVRKLPRHVDTSKVDSLAFS